MAAIPYLLITIVDREMQLKMSLLLDQSAEILKLVNESLTQNTPL